MLSSTCLLCHVRPLLPYWFFPPLDDLSICVNEVLTFPTTVVIWSVSAPMTLSICFMYLGAPIFGAHMLMSVNPLLVLIALSLYNALLYLLKPILSDMSIVTPALFSFHFSWNIFNALTFSLCVSLGLKWVSRLQHIEWSCLAIQ